MDAILERAREMDIVRRQREPGKLFNTELIRGHKLDLGSGADAPGNGDWTTFDISTAFRPHVKGTAIALPFADDTFIAILCHHVLEHLSREQLIPAMNEAWRVMAPGGKIWIEVPLFPTEDAVADPAHVSFFVAKTFDYFTKRDGHDEHRLLYGIKPWDMVTRQRINNGRAFSCVLEKVAE